MDAPIRIWASPDMGQLDANGWAGVMDGKDRLFWEGENAHHPSDDGVEYVRADEIERLRAIINRAGALACQKAPYSMILDALAEFDKSP